MDINKIYDDANKKSSASVDNMTFSLKPYWINDVTRLNAQNFNSILYSSLKSNIQAAVNNGYLDTNNELKNILTILPGFKVSDTSTSEVHNTESGNGTTTNNSSNGAYQAIFGKNNISTNVEGQFLTGVFANPDASTLFAVGNGKDDINRSNAFSVSKQGDVSVTDITTNYISLNNEITDDSNEKYAATKKYVFDKVANEEKRAKQEEATLTNAINTETSRATAAEETLTANLNAEISRAKQEEESIRSIASSAFRFMGKKDSYDDLPKTGMHQGDVWQVEDKEYAWDGDKWVELGFNIDLSPYAKITYVDTGLSNKVDNTSTGGSSLLSKLDTGTAVPADNIYYISQGASGSTKYVRKPIASLNSYIKGKADTTATSSSSNLITSGAVYTGLSDKQDKLTSGTNIKTINNESILGSGNINISAGGTVDSSLSTTSENPVQNKVITEKINSLDFGSVDKTSTQNSVYFDSPGDASLKFSLKSNETYITTAEGNSNIILRNQRSVAEYEDEATSKAYVDSQGAAVALGEYINAQSWTVPKNSVAPLPVGVRCNVNILNPQSLVTQSNSLITYNDTNDVFTISGEFTNTVSISGGGVAKSVPHALQFDSNIFDHATERAKNVPYTVKVIGMSGRNTSEAYLSFYTDDSIVPLAKVYLPPDLEAVGSDLDATVVLNEMPTKVILEVGGAPYDFIDYNLQIGLMTSDSQPYYKYTDIDYGSIREFNVFIHQTPSSPTYALVTPCRADGEILFETDTTVVANAWIIGKRLKAIGAYSVSISDSRQYPYNLKYLQDISTSLTEPYKIGTTQIATKDYVDNSPATKTKDVTVTYKNKDNVDVNTVLRWNYRIIGKTIECWGNLFIQSHSIMNQGNIGYHSENSIQVPLPFPMLGTFIKKSDGVTMSDGPVGTANIVTYNWTTWVRCAPSPSQDITGTTEAELENYALEFFTDVGNPDLTSCISMNIKGTLK